LTGFSASVLRSAAMFTFIIFSDASNKSSSIHNTIGASMFVLLLWNPLLVMDVGFQLSYLALMGIVLWQPILQVLWNPDNKLLKHFWSIVSVSIAAQLATFPLAFFYFHQFPVYFLWANLIIIPVSSLILYLGMLASFLCFNFTLSSPFYFLLDFFLKFLNASTVFFQKLPHSLLEGISWSVAEIFLLYAAFFLVSKFIQSYKIIFLKISLLCFFCTMLLWIQDFLAITQQKMLIVYCVKKHSAIDFIEGERNCLLADESLLASPEKINQNIRPNWWKLHLKETSIYPIHCLMKTNRIGGIRFHNSIIEFRSKKILLLNRHSVHDRPCLLKEKIDWLVLSDNAAASIKSLFEKFHFELIVFDASNDPAYTKQCIQECLQLRLPYYSISEKGAFVTRVE
jgi:competence protein ComEC